MRSVYIKVAEAYWDFIRALPEENNLQLLQLLDLAAALRFGLEHDYQQDKHHPSWNVSEQPGPTYFYSRVDSTQLCIDVSRI